jgi:hypothetical protein
LHNVTSGGNSNDGIQVGSVSNDSIDGEIWNFENGYMRIGTNGLERLRVESGGNVGIGTTDAQKRLHVDSGTANEMAMFELDYDASAQPWGATIQVLNSNPAQDNRAGIGFMGMESDLEAGRFLGGISGVATHLSATSTGMGGALSFWTNTVGDTNYSEKMRITHDGLVGIGSTNPSVALDVNGQTKAKYLSGTDLTIDWNDGNIQETNAAAGTLVFSNMYDGTGYTLALTNGTGGSYVLSGGGVTVWRCSPVCTGAGTNEVTLTGGNHLVMTILKMGTKAYVSWIDGL